MYGIEAARAFGYALGEEVIADMTGVEVFAIEYDATLAAPCAPAWTIGLIVCCVRREEQPAYVLAFEHHGSRCLCIADESAIEGVA